MLTKPCLRQTPWLLPQADGADEAAPAADTVVAAEADSADETVPAADTVVAAEADGADEATQPSDVVNDDTVDQDDVASIIDTTGFANLAGSGQLQSLINTASGDGELAALVKGLNADGLDGSEFRANVEEIVKVWTDSSFTDFYQSDEEQSADRVSDGLQNALEQYFGFDYFSRSEYEEVLEGVDKVGDDASYDASIHAQKMWLQPTIGFVEVWQKLIDDLTVKLVVQTQLTDVNLTYDLSSDTVVYTGADAAGDFRHMADSLLDAGMADEAVALQIRVLNAARPAFGIDEIAADRQIVDALHDTGLIDDAELAATTRHLDSRETGHADLPEAELKSHFEGVADQDVTDSADWQKPETEAQTDDDYRVVAVEGGGQQP